MEQKRQRSKRDKGQELARQRALVILKVRSGVLTAKQGALALGVSRKTYYEWEEKSLQAMALALQNQPAGRKPAPVDEACSEPPAAADQFGRHDDRGGVLQVHAGPPHPRVARPGDEPTHPAHRHHAD